MIKFFRKIRQKLLSERKFGNYLLYAIGEIVLVVIGILLALQINTWNDVRKKNKLKASYRESLINDLSLDTLKLNEMIAENYKTLETLNNQRDRFLGPNTPIDTLIKIARFEFEPGMNISFQYNRNTVNALTASGTINLFNKENNELLINLISMQDVERENSNYYFDIYSTKISRFSDNYPVSGHDNSSVCDLIWKNADEKKLASNFIGLTDIKAFSLYRFINEIEEVKEKTTLLLDQINKQD